MCVARARAWNRKCFNDIHKVILQTLSLKIAYSFLKRVTQEHAGESGMEFSVGARWKLTVVKHLVQVVINCVKV